MSEAFESKILGYLRSSGAKPLRPRKLFRQIEGEEEEYGAFRGALKQLMREGRVVLGGSGSIVLPAAKQQQDRIIGTYRQHRRGFGFVIPTDPTAHEDLYIPQGQSNGALSGDIVSAKITSRGQRDGKTLYEGRIMEVLERTHTRFVGTLVRQHGQWLVLPDGNVLTEPIRTPDAGSWQPKEGLKVVVELTTHPTPGQWAEGVIAEVLGRQGEKDVDLKSVLVQFNLPADFPEEVTAQARRAIDRFNAGQDWADRYDLSDQIICTIDPDDAKDYDDAISLRRKDDGRWELGVHIADVAYFVPEGTPLDVESQERGNSIYFPGYVIPMLPPILSNGVCSLQEGVPRLCKSVFITFDEQARPAGVRCANTIIRSANRLRYREAQAIIDRADKIPHPEGARQLSDYSPAVIKLLDDMNSLARRIQKRRLHQGQIVLDLPEVELVLDDEGKIAGTEPEDVSFTHTLIEMFMVEANEAVARLLDSLEVPFLRRVHPGPEIDSAERLRHFVQVAGHHMPKEIDHKAIQALLNAVKGKPEGFAINLAVLKSLSRAEYSPEPLGHYALASEHYTHFTSPIRRYADLMVHRLLDQYIRLRDARMRPGSAARTEPTDLRGAARDDQSHPLRGEHPKTRRRKSVGSLSDVIPFEKLVQIGRHISFTERRADDAERELRQIKILELLQKQLGEEFMGVVTGITNFGIFVQLQDYLIDGLIRYEDLMDDWWNVDERSGIVRGERTGQKIGIGDVARVIVVNVDVPRRELKLAVAQVLGRTGQPQAAPAAPAKPKHGKSKKQHAPRGNHRKGPVRPGRRSKRRR